MDPQQAAFRSGPVVKVVDLVKRFGNFTAVDGLSFSVKRGECFGLLGPNGAGKSTTLRLVLGLLAPSSGSIELVGEPVPARALEARQRVGVVPQADALDPDFTVLENLRVYGRYFGLGGRALEARLPGLLAFAGLEQRGDAAITALSGGMKRRLAIARALVNDPDVLFLDEPTTGLDPQARHLVWDRLKRLVAQGKTIVLTTHFMEEAERLCDRLAVVDHGRIVTEGSPQALVRREIEPQVLEITGAALDAWVAAVRDAAAGDVRLERVGETVFAYCQEASALMSSAEAAGLRCVHRRANLEDLFLKLTGRDLRD